MTAEQISDDGDFVVDSSKPDPVARLRELRYTVGSLPRQVGKAIDDVLDEVDRLRWRPAERETTVEDSGGHWSIQHDGTGGYEIHNKSGECVGKYANPEVAAAHHVFALQELERLQKCSQPRGGS